MLDTPLRRINKAADKVVAGGKNWLNGKGGSAASEGWVGVPVEYNREKGHTFKLWTVVDSAGVIHIMRQLDGQPKVEFDLARDVPASQKIDATLRAKVETGLANLKAHGAAAYKADADAKKAAPVIPGKPTDGKVSPSAAALKQVAADLKVEMQALVDAKADCFFGLACFSAGTPLRVPGAGRRSKIWESAAWC